ncbi:MAG: hypothetical protein L7F77_16710 [Candidatus Magnetominusculus sp. LBB02]|nr:hypothetical protein [Candidatus Magnetominusculus sp. LBB02]
MKIEEAIQEAINGNAVLFTGSGFSASAENLRGSNIKTGSDLAMGKKMETCLYIK